MSSPDDIQRKHTINVEVRCKDCYHYTHVRAGEFTDVCSKLGVLPIARPCKNFLVDFNSFLIHKKIHQEFADCLDQIPTARLSAFAAFIQQEKTTRRYGFSYGEKVYIKIYPDEYLSNYVSACVIEGGKKRIFVQGLNQKFTGMFLPQSVLSGKDFSNRKKFLIERNLIRDPNLAKYTTWKMTPKVKLDYEPPSIDDVMNTVKDKNIITARTPLDKIVGDTIKLRG